MEGLQQGDLDIYQLVLRRCQAILRDQPDAEDAAQEVFTRAAAAGRNGFDVDWLLGVATHVCVDEFRRRGRLRRAMTQAGAMADAADPEETAVGEMLAHHLISHLSPLEARLLSHRVETGASLEESANHLGIAASTARNLAMRIRQKLRPLIPQLGPLPGALAWLKRLRERIATATSAEPMMAPAAIAIVALALGQLVAGGDRVPPFRDPASTGPDVHLVQTATVQPVAVVVGGAGLDVRAQAVASVSHPKIIPFPPSAARRGLVYVDPGGPPGPPDPCQNKDINCTFGLKQPANPCSGPDVQCNSPIVNQTWAEAANAVNDAGNQVVVPTPISNRTGQP